MSENSKSDQKNQREKIAGWQGNYMERLIKEYISFLSSVEPATPKFWEMEKRIKQDKKRLEVLIGMENHQLFMIL